MEATETGKNQGSLRIALVAGEASGDQLGAGLIQRLRAQLPRAEFAGIGGPLMIAAGLQAWWPAERLSVMGVFEVLRHLPGLLRLRRELVDRTRNWKPDVFIGIDAPDFNLEVERRLKAGGVRTVHYVSPSIWAWREKRAAKIARSADRVLCLFPMEPAIYRRYGIAASYVGHPLADAFARLPTRETARETLGLAGASRVLALLPGSRLGEIRRLGAAFLGAAARVLDAFPDLRIIAPMASASCRNAFEEQLQRVCDTLSVDRARQLRASLRVVDGQSHLCLIAADAALVASGTAALEALLAERPMVVGYRIAPLTAWLLRLFNVMKSRRFSLPNVLADDDLVPELIQERCTAEALATELLRHFCEPDRVAGLLPRYRAIAAQLRCDADNQAADAIAGIIASPLVPPC